jgi:hypothetical protein
MINELGWVLDTLEGQIRFLMYRKKEGKDWEMMEQQLRELKRELYVYNTTITRLLRTVLIHKNGGSKNGRHTDYTEVRDAETDEETSNYTEDAESTEGQD